MKRVLVGLQILKILKDNYNDGTGGYSDEDGAEMADLLDDLKKAIQGATKNIPYPGNCVN